jgi:hypothetical protein
MTKNTFYGLFILMFLLISCKGNSQKDAEKTAGDIQSMVKEHTPGTVATSESGYYMKATINGKEWTASEMMPPERPSRIIGYNNKESISLPYDRRDMVVGNKTNFKNSAVDLMLNDDVGIWGGHSGEMEITKVDDKSAEGKFYFTADGLQSDKKMEVTNGVFRILFSDK